MDTIKIRFLGKTPKIVELPVPYISKSERTGQVICDPVGEFPIEDGERLLEISGSEGMFIREVELPPEPEPELGPFCACGCGERIEIKVHHKSRGIPKYRLGHWQLTHNAIPKPSEADETDRPGE